jgi:catechol 2,3-dioxygenase-like lactoylglutathione lyase family enzyme
VLDHVGFAISDYDRSLAFYKAALKPLGYGLVMEVPREVTGGDTHAGFGPEGRPYFWIGTGTPLSGRLHVAFAASSRADVDAFHEAALRAGGTDNGKPGLRPVYHPHYYGAFVLDPDGHNVEAVCHLP